MIDYTLPLDQLPDPLPIEPLRKPFDVTITPPGSKSITCRAYVLAALAKGESKIIRPLRADDTDLLLEALCTLGAEARWAPGGEDVYIKGVNGRFPRGGSVYLGDGGTPTRFMIACACLAADPVVVDASPRMRERPIAEGVEMLRQLGARIEYVEEEGRLPVRVAPNETLGGVIDIPRTSSSQFISALMLVASCMTNQVTVRFRGGITSSSYVELTEHVLDDWKCWIERDGKIGYPILGYRLSRQVVGCREYDIPADSSSALYWYLAAAISTSCSVNIPTIGTSLLTSIHQPDSQATSSVGINSSPALFIKGNTHLSGTGQVLPIRENAEAFPDGAIALAVYASCVNSHWSDERREHAKRAGITVPPDDLVTTLTGLRTLRVKETDRIAALANELRKVGCTIETGEDWISITPPVAQSNAPHAGSDRREDPDRTSPTSHASGSSSLRSSDPASIHSTTKAPVIIETYNDHRMAMAFAVLGLVRPGISIRNPACVKKSYPGFWRDFAKLHQ